MNQRPQATPDPMSNERPSSPTCGKRMMLTRIEPETPGIEKHNFECGKCRHQETKLVAYR